MLTASHGGRVSPEPQAQLHLWSAAARNQHLILHSHANDVQSVIHGPFQLIDHVLSPAAENYGDGLGVGALLNKCHLVVADLPLLDQSGFP